MGITPQRKVTWSLSFTAKLSGADPQLLRQLESEMSLVVWDQERIYLDPLESLRKLTARVSGPLLHGWPCVFFMTRWISFSLLLIFPLQRPTGDLIKEISRTISEGVSLDFFKGQMPIDIYMGMATSGGLPVSIHALATGVSTVSLDGNITTQVFSELIQ